ncbi:hypothetical protein OG978_36635 [Streptomyces sp. NBC_01591]|uniref:hypothetical protein n=1 Tax=Streptomyces sp. NBC_01591 TaxID=2975888 RepID=UPI002DDB3179|nr:hypothetical protein [Streptomyces sp. NBC_01591]WSD72448.1 hypothetical protein OG978_36635 [Streptomyces sp. NBC_01591]
MSHDSDRPKPGNGRWIGRSVPRVEDDRLLRGNGRSVDDIALHGAVEAAFLRSPHAHARIESVDVTASLAAPGVVAVWPGDDVADLPAMLSGEELRTPPSLAELLDPLVRMTPMPLLAREKVVYVGRPVAVVLAENRYLAEDALEIVRCGTPRCPCSSTQNTPSPWWSSSCRGGVLAGETLRRQLSRSGLFPSPVRFSGP